MTAKTLETQLDNFHQAQTVLARILEFSAQAFPLNVQLDRALDLILTIPWLTIESKGCIFLVDDERRHLTMAAQRGLPPEVGETCQTVLMGRCLCGKAAEENRVIYAPAVDAEHEITFPEMPDHGHYCLPLKKGAEVIGVLNLYIQHGHAPNQAEEDFLTAAAHALVGVIERKRSEEALAETRRELDQLSGRQAFSHLITGGLIDHVFRAWERGGVENHWPPPSASRVRSILETVFVAGLQKKEEFPIQISVTLLEYPSMVEEVSAYDSQLLRFEEPFPFDPETLVSLAPSFDPINTSLLLVPSGPNGDDLVISGAVSFTHHNLHRFNAQTFALSPLDLLSVCAGQSGRMLVFRGNEMIARFATGHMSHSTTIPFTESPMTWFLLRAAQTHPEYRQLGMAYWDAYRDLMDRLLLESSRRSHGGAIIWLPPEALDAARTWIEWRQPLSKGPDASSFLGSFTELERESPLPSASPDPELLTCKRQLIEHIEVLAQMTAGDGTLVVTDRLKALSFGSMLTAPAWRGEVVSFSGDEPFPSGGVDISKYGARHNSALNFVGHCPGSVAFVFSQDGPITGMTRKNPDTIYWWPDCLIQF